MSADRFLSVWFKNWKIKYFKSKQAFIVSFVLVTFFTLLNLNVWFTYGYREYNEMNGTFKEYCHSDKTPTLDFMKAWNLVSLICYELIFFRMSLTLFIQLIQGACHFVSVCALHRACTY